MNNEFQWTAKNELTWKKSAGGFSSQWSSPPEGPHGWLRPVEHAATHTLRHQSGNNMQHDQHVDSFKQIAYRQPMMATAKNDSSYSNLSPLESGSRCQFRCMSLLPYLDESPQCTHLLHNRSQNLQHAVVGSIRRGRSHRWIWCATMAERLRYKMTFLKDRQ